MRRTAVYVISLVARPVKRDFRLHTPTGERLLRTTSERLPSVSGSLPGGRFCGVPPVTESAGNAVLDGYHTADSL